MKTPGGSYRREHPCNKPHATGSKLVRCRAKSLPTAARRLPSVYRGAELRARAARATEALGGDGR